MIGSFSVRGGVRYGDAPALAQLKNEKNRLRDRRKNKKGGVVFEIIHDKDGGGMA